MEGKLSAMYAMQYALTLPADYDMQIIRQRVSDHGHLFDDRAGLGFKAFLIRERGVDGSPVNEYAPCYLWNDIAAMAGFLVGGGGFQNIVRDFGRPAVQHWTGLGCEAGPARAGRPRAASRRTESIPADADLVALVEGARDELRLLAEHEAVHTAVLAIDPQHWQLLRFVLWEQTVPEDTACTERYEVLHLSASNPDLRGSEQLPTGTG